MNRFAVPFVLTAFLTGVSSTALASDECKGVKVKDDQFGGGKQVEVYVAKMSMISPVALRIEHKAGQTNLTVLVKEGGAVKAIVEAGLEIPVRLDNGEVLNLKTATDSTGKSYVDGASVLTTMTYALPVTTEQLKQMAASPPAAMRLPVIGTSTTHDWNVPGRTQKKVQQIAACLATF